MNFDVNLNKYLQDIIKIVKDNIFGDVDAALCDHYTKITGNDAIYYPRFKVEYYLPKFINICMICMPKDTFHTRLVESYEKDNPLVFWIVQVQLLDKVKYEGKLHIENITYTNEITK